jgi:feruloyl esterase
MTSLADAVMKIFVHKNDPNYQFDESITFGADGSRSIKNFHIIVPESEVALGRSEARIGIGAHPESAATLIKMNRKLFIWANLSDEKLTPYTSIKQLAKLYGGYSKLQQTFVFSCCPVPAISSMNGCGPTSFDALGAMEEWVEKSAAPDGLHNLVGIDLVVLPLRRGNSTQHQRVCHFHLFSVREQVIVDPTGENRSLHRHHPELG